MLPTKPYFIRAFYELLVDNQLTPFVIIQSKPFAENPALMSFDKGGKIVFNISPTAVEDLRISNESIFFRATFSGIEHTIIAPIRYLMAIYAAENGEGLFFEEEKEEEGGDSPPPKKETAKEKKRKHLKVIK